MTEEGLPDSSPALRLPGHGRRLVAFVIDAAVPLAAIVGTAVWRSLSDLGGGQTMGLLVLVALVLGSTNGIITWLSGGTTAGKAWAGLQVRRLDHRPIAPSPGELPRVLLRHTVGYFLIDVLLLGCLNALRDSRRRPLHDYVLGYEVVALADVPDTTRERLQRFGEDLAAGQALIREQWKTLGIIVAAYVGVVSSVNKGLALTAHQIGLSAPSAQSVGTTTVAVNSAAVPSSGVALGLTVGGTALSAATIAGLSVALATATTAYPDEIMLIPAVQFEDGAYPMGIPSDIQLELNRRGPLTKQELDDLIVLEAADHATATLTYTDGEFEGRSFTFEDVVLPVEWRIEDPSNTDIVSWRNLEVSAADDEGFVPEGTAVADVRHVDGETYAGYTVASTGDLTLSFPYRGDGSGGIEEVGVVVTWEGDMECVIVNDDLAAEFDFAEACDDKYDEMFWVWGEHGVTWG